jgi:cytochrome c556
MVADLAEGDLDGARGLFEEFKTDYVEISKSVPEWKKEYPVGPVEALGAALKVGDPKKVMVAHGKVAEVCHNCHAAYMAPVHQRYHWGDFSAIRVKDPLSDEDVPFGRLNQYLDANFAGIALNLERGHRERARKQFQGFNARFQALKTTCKTCHAGQMRHYVDETVQGLVDNLGAALDTPSSDPSSMTDLIRKIGMESCFKCHLVHVPAAFAKSKGRRGTAATP